MSAHQLAAALSCHAWNADRSMIAVCPNNNEVWIFTGCHNPDSSTWVKQWVLTEHDLLISGIDWSPVTNKIVTCSHDRNAFVWSLSEDGASWEPALVILRINRAALACKWSYDGNKFAVTSGAKCMPVCNYETDNSWWISKMVKKPGNALPGFAKNGMFKSSVVALDWHPNNELLATGCCDFFCRVFSAYNEGLDEGADSGALGMARQPFGNIVYQAQASGWVETVAWSPSGNVLAFGAHDSSVGVTDFSTGTPIEHHISMTTLPLLVSVFLADDTLVAAGYDFNPCLLTQSECCAQPFATRARRACRRSHPPRQPPACSFACADANEPIVPTPTPLLAQVALRAAGNSTNTSTRRRRRRLAARGRRVASPPHATCSSPRFRAANPHRAARERPTSSGRSTRTP